MTVALNFLAENSLSFFFRDEEGVRAFRGTCTHYGAPLAKGDFRDNRIVCPWHGACFNATTGELIPPPPPSCHSIYCPMRVHCLLVSFKIILSVPQHGKLNDVCMCIAHTWNQNSAYMKMNSNAPPAFLFQASQIPRIAS
jgi:nitrite reductase/ring-hydroxylating ferredoxin subunit